MKNNDSDAAKFDLEATAAAASIGALIEPHLQAGANPLLLGFACIAFGASLMAKQTTPGDVAMTLTAMAGGLTPKATPPHGIH